MSNETEIDFRHVVPYELRGVSDSYTTRSDVMTSYTSSQYIKLASNNPNSSNSQYVIRNSVPVSSHFVERQPCAVTMKLMSAGQTITAASASAYAAGAATVNFTVPMPAVPQYSSLNAVAQSYNVILGSGSIVSANVSDSIIPLSIYSLDRPEYWHDQTNASVIENFANRPVVGDAIFADKVLSLKGPYVGVQNGTYSSCGNANDPYGDYTLVASSVAITSATPNVNNPTLAFTLSPSENLIYCKISFTVAAAIAANTNIVFSSTNDINLTVTYMLQSPLCLGFDAMNAQKEMILTNCSQIQINKVVANELNAFIFLYDFSANTDLSNAISNASATNGANTLTITIASTGVVTAGTRLLNFGTGYIHYKLVNLPQKLIPTQQSFFVWDYSQYNTQSIPTTLRYVAPGNGVVQGTNFTSQAFVLSVVPSAIYLWVGYQSSILTTTNSKIAQAQIVSIQNINLNGRSIMSGLSSDSFIVNSVMMKDVKRSLCDFGYQSVSGVSCGGIGTYIRIPLRAMQLDGYSEGMSANLQFQISLNIALLNEDYTNADLPANALTFFILAPYKKLCVLSNNSLSINSNYLTKDVYDAVVNEETSYMSYDNIAFGGSWLGDAWDSIKSGIQSGIDQVKDAASWAWKNKNELMKGAETLAPLLGLGEEESREFLPRDKNGNTTLTAGRVMTREEMKRRLHK